MGVFPGRADRGGMHRDRPAPSVDAAMVGLADQYRRRLLVALLEQGPGRPVHAEDISGAGTDRQTADIEIRHVHLPRLVADGYIGWDRTTDAVWRGPNFAAIRPLVSIVADDDFPEDRV